MSSIKIPQSVLDRAAGASADDKPADDKPRAWRPGDAIKVPEAVRQRAAEMQPPPPPPPKPTASQRIAEFSKDPAGRPTAPADGGAFPMGRGLSDTINARPTGAPRSPAEDDGAAPATAADMLNVGVNAAATPAAPGSTVLDRPTVPDDGGLTPAEMQEGSISPAGRQKIVDAKRAARPYAQAKPTDAFQNMALDLRDATDNPVARGVAAGFSQLGKVGTGAVRLAADVLGADSVARFAQAAEKGAGATAGLSTIDLKGPEKLVSDVTSSIVATVPSVTLGMIGGPALTTLFAQSVLSEYGAGRDAGFDVGESLGRATIYGFGEAIGERFGFPQQIALLKSVTQSLPSGELAKVFGSMLMREIPGEQLTTLIQFMADKMGPAALAPNATIDDYLKAAGDTLAVTVGQTLVMGGGPAGIGTVRDQMRRADATTLTRQDMADAQAAKVIDQEADLFARYFAPKAAATPMPPSMAKSESLRRFDEAAAAFGLSPKAAAKVREQSGAMPADEMPGFLGRVLRAFSERGLTRKPVDEQSLSELRKVVDAADAEGKEGPAETAPAGADATPDGSASPVDDYTGLDTGGTLQPALDTDIKTGDGQPYGTRAGAQARATKEGGGNVVEVVGGWVVRKAEKTDGTQPDVAVPAAVSAAPADGGSDQSGGGLGNVGPDPAAPAAGVGNAAAAPSPGGQTDAAAGVAGQPDAALTPGPRIIGKVGRTPKAAEDVELRENEDGSLTPWMGGYEMLDYETGDPLVLPRNITDAQAAQMIRAAGAVSQKDRFYGVKPDTVEPTDAGSDGGPQPGVDAQTAAVAAGPAPVTADDLKPIIDLFDAAAAAEKAEWDKSKVKEKDRKSRLNFNERAFLQAVQRRLMSPETDEIMSRTGESPIDTLRGMVGYGDKPGDWAATTKAAIRKLLDERGLGPFALKQGDRFTLDGQDWVVRKTGDKTYSIATTDGKTKKTITTSSDTWKKIVAQNKGKPAPAAKTLTLDELKARTVRFASGLSRLGDLEAGAAAAGGRKDAGVGADVGELSPEGISMLAHAILNLDARVFVDSGAFSAFRRGLRSGEFTPMRFGEVLAKYDLILAAMEQLNPSEKKVGQDYPAPMFVMPDVVGDQTASLELVGKYRQWIAPEVAAGRVRPIVPIQKGEMSMAEAYRKVVAMLGSDNFVVGIPSNEQAVSPEELTEFLREATPKAIHILGAASDKRLTPRLQSIVDAGLTEIEVSADASPIRNQIATAVANGASRGDAIADFLLDPETREAKRQQEAKKAAREAARLQRETQVSVFREIEADAAMVGKTDDELRTEIVRRAGAVALPDDVLAKMVESLQKKLKARAAELEKQKNRDPAVLEAAIVASMPPEAVRGDLLNAPEKEAAYRAGFAHALAGKTKSTLSGDHLPSMLSGYEAARRWIDDSEEGAAWYEGRPVNKLQNTGIDLKRWFDQLKSQMKENESDAKKAWRQIERATARADLFRPLLPEGVKPGFQAYVEHIRDNTATFKQWLDNDRKYDWYGNSYFRSRYSNSKSNIEYILDGERYPGKLTKEDQEKFRTDEAYRAQWLRDQADEYIGAVRGFIELFEGRSGVQEAAEKFSERYVQADTTAAEDRWSQKVKLNDAGNALAASPLWTGQVSSFSQLRLNSAWTQTLIEKEATLKLPDRATPLTPPKLDRVTRDGPNRRAGNNVTPKDFEAMFGFASVGFGNWVAAKQDQDHLNYAYDAFADLATHFGAPMNGIGFGGTLHFTIGALGHGKFAAHFSPAQPSPIGPVPVINLTNTRGDGTVYHEWVHALDNQLGGDWRARVRPAIQDYLVHGVLSVKDVENRARDFLYGGWYFQGDKRLPKDEAAVRGLRGMRSRRTSAYKTNADALGKDYWGNDKELLARAGEAWAVDTLGFTNTYLVNPAWVGEAAVTKAKGYRGTPYPTGDERRQFNLILGALAKSVKWENGKPTVKMADFEAALPDEILAGERRRVELMQLENMRAFKQAEDDRRELEAQAKRDEEAEAQRLEQEEMDRLAAQKLAELEAAKTPVVVDTPAVTSENQPLTDDELSDLFDEAAAELREQKQERPDEPPPGESPAAPVAETWTQADLDEMLAEQDRSGASGIATAVKLPGFPTIHELGDMGKTAHLGYGMFETTGREAGPDARTLGKEWRMTWDGGGAMKKTASGKAYTMVFVTGPTPFKASLQDAMAAVAPADERALPDWVARELEQHQNWNIRLDGDMLVGEFKGKEVARVKAAGSENFMNRNGFIKAMLEASIVDLGGDADLTWKPEGGDTSVEDARARREQAENERSRARRALEAAIEAARAAGANETVGKLSLMLGRVGAGTGPKAAFDAAENVDRMIQRELDKRGDAVGDWPTSTEQWWDKEMTHAGRRILLGHAGLKLPDAVLWRHLSPENRDKLERLRGTMVDPIRDNNTPDDRPAFDDAAVQRARDRIAAGRPLPADASIVDRANKRQVEAAAQDATAADLIKKAAGLGVKGADEALKGLSQLFGGPGKLNSFPGGFDEETYQKAKPHFQAALQSFQEAGKTLKDLFKLLIEQFGDGIKEYAVRFAKDLKLAADLGSQQTPSMTLALRVKGMLEGRQAFDWRVLFEAADAAFGGTQAAGVYTPKDAYDALELGINLYIKANPGAFSPSMSREDALVAVTRLRELLELVPTQTKRTAEQDEFQQFSTVPPFAFVANWAANIAPTDTVGEFSAGVGGLAVFAHNAGAGLILNELSSRRAALLRTLFPTATVHAENAEQIHNILPADEIPTVVVINPPFSSAPGRGIKSTSVGAQHVDQALARLAPGGRFVGIVGEGMAMDRPAFREWWAKVSAKYDVRAAIPVSGKGYAKYGTTFDNVLLVIDKVKPVAGRKPITTPAEDYTELLGLLSEVRDDRPTVTRIPVDGGAAAERDTAESALGQPGPAAVEPGADPAGPAGVGGAEPLQQPAGGRTGSGRGRAGGANRPASGVPEPGGRQDAASGDAAAGGVAAGVTDAGDSGLTVAATTVKASGELTDSVFDSYRPQRLEIPGAKPHPGALVESAAMASVEPPPPTYTPNLPKEVIEKGLLSLAQLEAVVYAGQAHGQLLDARVPDTRARDLGIKAGMPYRRGYFIGDGTGVGKGREISGVILDNWRQGRKKHVWVSEKQGLMGNKSGTGEGATRDFKGIGGDPSLVFNLANKTEAGTWKVTAENGVMFTTYATLRSAQKYGNYDSGDEVVTKDGRVGELTSTSVKNKTVNVRFPGQKKVTKLSFDDVESIDGDPTWRATIGRDPPPGFKPRTRIDQIVEWLGPDFDGVIAFDEAHNAGNAVAVKGARGDTDVSAQAAAVVELQERLPNARVLYVSATGATEVSNLSFATRLGLWGMGTAFPTVTSFINQMTAGGLATMELVARDMKQTGSYLARSLSYDGVVYSRLEHELTDIQVDIYNRLSDAWQVVLQNMAAALELTGATSESGKAKNSRAVANMKSAFWGTQQRFFNQIITSMQMPSVIEQLEQDLAAGHAPVLQLVNTNEAAQERALAKKGEQNDEDLEDLDLTPRQALEQMVTKAFPVQQYQDTIDPNTGKTITVPVMDSRGQPVLNAEAVAMRDQLLKDLKDIRVPDGPLEILLNTFGPDVVAEVTGRKQRVVRKPDADGNVKAQIEKRGAAAAKADAEAFMEDKKRILVFSDAGGTGFSFQADLGKKNQRLRKHYLIQPGWRANKAVQGLGRTHRSNQKQPPVFVLAATNIPAHKRFLSSIARRLDQLGALTKGQRDTSSGGLFSEKDNLESVYATQAVKRLLDEARLGQIDGVNFQDLLKQLGLEDIVNPDTGLIAENKYPPTTQFLNRMLSMKLDMQEKVFVAFMSRIDEQVELAAQRGALDTGMQTIKALETRILQEEVVYTDGRTGAETKYIELELVKPNLFHKFPTEASQGQKVEYLKNVKSGRVWARVRSGNQTLKDGSIVERYRMFSTGGMQIRNERDFTELVPGSSPAKWQDNGNYAAITEDEAATLWDKENAVRPQTYTDKAHLIVGAMLPIWDRLKTDGVIQVVRTQTKDGRRLLGRMLAPKEVSEVQKRLNVSPSTSKLPPDQIMARVLKGEVGELANGWRLERAKVSDDLRIEVRFGSFMPAGAGNELVSLGVIRERINWNDRYFVPTSEPDVLAAVLKNKPLVDLRDPNAAKKADDDATPMLSQASAPPPTTTLAQRVIAQRPPEVSREIELRKQLAVLRALKECLTK